jgi:flagellar hook-associated protein 3 FlgL
MSGFRVNPYPMPDILSALENLQQQQDTATLELATGSKINKPSDDPAGTAQEVIIGQASSLNDTYQQSIGSINGQLSTADSTLNSVVTVLQRALSLGVEGANGTLSDTDRADIVSELTGIQSQLVSLANTTYQDQFLFAGTANRQPYVLNEASPSGVTYQGNSGTNFVTIGNGYQLQVNLPGSQIFNGPDGADVFQSISDLITALNNNTDISNAVNEISDAYNYVTGERVFYGNAMDQTQSQQTFLNSQQLDISQQENTVGSADVATVASELASDETATNATLGAIGTMPRDSLFDYLR